MVMKATYVDGEKRGHSMEVVVFSCECENPWYYFVLENNKYSVRKKRQH